MKKLLLLLLALPLLLSSCDDDGYYYSDYDNYLPGSWELIYADGRAVSGYQVNYLDFFKNGSGYYYYYDHGTPYKMALSWGVDMYGSGQVLYITYADGTQASMDYWYNSNATRLYTQWWSGNVQHQYVYQLVSTFDWPYYSPARSADEQEEEFTTLLPGL